MQIALGQSVISSDGQKIGIIERVLLNPSGNYVEHFVVHHGITLSDDKVIARAAIARVDSSGVHLSIDAEAAKTLPKFEYTFAASKPNVPLPDVIPAPFQGMIFFPSLPTTQLDVLYGQSFDLDRVETDAGADKKPGDIVIGKGADVIAADGQRVGNVHEVAYGVGGTLESVVVQSGLVRHQRLTIPASQIGEIGHEEIVLNVSAAELPNPEKTGFTIGSPFSGRNKETRVAWDWELLDGPDTITEGPVWDGTGLIYTAINHNEIRRYDPATGAISALYADSGEANGLALGSDGTLYACEGGRRAIAAYDPSGQRTSIADRFEGARLNSPNDLVIDSAGRIWFTDPRYGDDHSDRELDHDSVYRLTPSAEGWSIERMTFDTTRPNGLLLSPDERTLYVAQSDYTPTAARQLRAYPVLDDGSLGEHRVLHDFGAHRGIDGMCFDSEGNIVATCGWEVSGPGPRIAIFTPDGALLEEHPLPDGRPTNCAFGGANLDVLYVTSITGHLYRVATTGRKGAMQSPTNPPFRGD